MRLNVDPKTDCVSGRLPHCPYCKKLARPNVLMFGDLEFLDNRLNEQTFKSNIIKAKAKLLVIELGAGTAVPTVRHESAVTFINPRWTADFIRIECRLNR